MLAAFPFVEWIIHVFVLHWKPRTIAGVTLDSRLARSIGNTTLRREPSHSSSSRGRRS